MTSSTTSPVCILGLGLIGGSLMRALARSGRPVFGYNRSTNTVDAAIADGFDVSSQLDATVRRAAHESALIVIATPVTALPTILTAIADFAPRCPITDVISVKTTVAEQIARYGLANLYVGSHPMAGTAESGWYATNPELFTDASWVVCTDDDSDPNVWGAVADIALTSGARVVPIGTDEHDRAVAAISHLPHVLAATTAAVGAGQGALALHLAAGSFRDGTRVSGTAVELQRAMLEANASALLTMISESIDLLTAARDELRTHGSVAKLITDGHRGRDHYDRIVAAPAQPITGTRIGDDGWARELRSAGQQGQVWLGD